MSRLFNPCPCYSKKMYDDCCKLLHTGKLAQSCEALMRSRYSAYALGLIDYIVETTHSKSRPADIARWKEEIEAFCKQTQFVGLEIEAAKENMVTFFARLKRGDLDVSFREKSFFTEEGARLVYVEGEITKA